MEHKDIADVHSWQNKKGKKKEGKKPIRKE
jgi:hypothetical protein